MDHLVKNGLCLIGCGFMGKSLLEGWLAAGVSPELVYISDPQPSEWVQSLDGVHVNAQMPSQPDVVLIAVKPQMLGDVLPQIADFGGQKTLIVSIAAGAPMSLFESHFGANTPIVRTMPNLPSAVGQGVTAIYPNENASEDQIAVVETLLSAVGTTVRLTQEDQMHLVTGVSGSGPAYVFALAEAMTKAAVAQGLPEALAKSLALQTVAGAGAMLAQNDADATALRVAVTSKGGTTAAGLDVLQRNEDGIDRLAHDTIAAATHRSRELADGS